MNDEYVLPDEVARLEAACARWTAEFAKQLPEEIRVTAFCGPASFREPEIDDVWHPVILKRGLFRFLVCYPPALFRSFGGGIRRFVLGRFGRYDEYLKNGAATIGIIPSTICKIENGNVITAYCDPEDATQMSWIVFDPAGRALEGYPVSRLKMLRMILRVLWAWGIVSNRGIRDRNWIFAAVISLRWLLGMQWIILWIFGLRVQEVVRNTKPSQVFCVHEMWPWSRAIWYALFREGVSGITIEHASITRSKLWYFPTADEIAAGLRIPKQFAVFSQKEKTLLEPFYPGTEFSIGCGPRFAHWKQRQVADFKVVKETDPILLVSSVPWWDNEVVLQAASALLRTTAWRPLVVRLHPLAVLRRRARRYLKNAQRKGLITISQASLRDDIARAAVVVGMNSTVLEEAAAMGRSIAVLQSNEYLSFGTNLGMHCKVSALGRTLLESCIAEHVSGRDEFMRKGREALGIDLPVSRLT